MSTLSVQQTCLPDLQGSSWRKDPFKHANFLSSTALGPVVAAGTRDAITDHTLGHIQIEAYAADVHARCEVLKAMRDLLSRQTATALKQAQIQQSQRQQQQAQPSKTRAAKAGRDVQGSQHADGIRLFQASMIMAQLYDSLTHCTAVLWPKVWEMKQPAALNMRVATVDPVTCCKQPGFSHLLKRTEMKLKVPKLAAHMSENVGRDHRCSQQLCKILDQFFAKGKQAVSIDCPNDGEAPTIQVRNVVWQDDDCWSDEEDIQEGLLEQIPLPSYLRGSELQPSNDHAHIEEAAEGKQAIKQVVLAGSKQRLPSTAIRRTLQNCDSDISETCKETLTAATAVASGEPVGCNTTPTNNETSNTADNGVENELLQPEMPIAPENNLPHGILSQVCEGNLVHKDNQDGFVTDLQYDGGDNSCDDMVPCSVNHAMRDKFELQAILDTSGSQMEIIYSQDDVPDSLQQSQQMDSVASKPARNDLLNGKDNAMKCDALEKDQLLDMLTSPMTRTSSVLLHKGSLRRGMHARFKQGVTLDVPDKRQPHHPQHTDGTTDVATNQPAESGKADVRDQQVADVQTAQPGAAVPKQKPAVMMRRAKYGVALIGQSALTHQQLTDEGKDVMEIVDDEGHPEARLPGQDGDNLKEQRQLANANLRKPMLRKRHNGLKTALAGPLPLQLSKQAHVSHENIVHGRSAVSQPDTIEDSDCERDYGNVADDGKDGSDREGTQADMEVMPGGVACKPIPRAVTIGRRRALLSSSQAMHESMSQGGTAVNKPQISIDEDDDTDTSDLPLHENNTEARTQMARKALQFNRPTQRAQVMPHLGANSMRDESQYLYFPDLSTANLKVCDVANNLQALQQDKKIRCRPVHNPSLLLNKPLSLPNMQAITHRAQAAVQHTNGQNNHTAPDPRMVSAVEDVAKLLKAALGEAAFSTLPAWPLQLPQPPQPLQPAKLTPMHNQQQQQVGNGLGNVHTASALSMQPVTGLPGSACVTANHVVSAVWQADSQVLDEEDEEFWMAIDAAVAARGKTAHNISEHPPMEPNAQANRTARFYEGCNDVADGSHLVAMSPHAMGTATKKTTQVSVSLVPSNGISAGGASVMKACNGVVAAPESCQRYGSKQQRRSGGRVFSGTATPIVSALDQLKQQGASVQATSAPSNAVIASSTTVKGKHCLAMGGVQNSNTSKRVRHSVQLLDDMFEMFDHSICSAEPDPRHQQRTDNINIQDSTFSLNPVSSDGRIMPRNPMSRRFTTGIPAQIKPHHQEVLVDELTKQINTDTHTHPADAAAPTTTNPGGMHTLALYGIDITSRWMDVDVDWGHDCSLVDDGGAADETFASAVAAPNRNNHHGHEHCTAQPSALAGAQNNDSECSHEHQTRVELAKLHTVRHLEQSENVCDSNYSILQLLASAQPTRATVELHAIICDPPGEQRNDESDRIISRDCYHKDTLLPLSVGLEHQQNQQHNMAFESETAGNVGAATMEKDNNRNAGERTAAASNAIRDLLALDKTDGLPVCDIQFDGFDEESETALHVATEAAIGNMTDRQLLEAAAKMKVGSNHGDWANVLPLCELVDWDMVEELDTDEPLHAPQNPADNQWPANRTTDVEECPPSKRHHCDNSLSNLEATVLQNTDNMNRDVAASNTTTLKYTNSLAIATGDLAIIDMKSDPTQRTEMVAAVEQTVQRRTVMSAREALKQRLVQEVLRLYHRSKVDLSTLMTYLATTFATRITSHMQQSEPPANINHGRHNGMHSTTTSADLDAADSDLVKVNWEEVVSNALADKQELFGQQEVTSQRLFLALLGLAHQNNTAMAQQAQHGQGTSTARNSVKNTGAC